MASHKVTNNMDGQVEKTKITIADDKRVLFYFLLFSINKL